MADDRPSPARAWQSLRRGCRAALTAAGVVVGLSLVGVLASNAWVALAARGKVATSLGGTPSRSVAIVPGTSVAAGQPQPLLRDRLEAARALYEEGRVRAILISGHETPTSPEVTVMSRWLRARGVPAADILIDKKGTRTRETMWHAAGELGVVDAVVCTQTLHMPRTLFLARAAGIDAVGIALPSRLSRVPRWVGIEVLKTSLAVVEAMFREGPIAGNSGPAALALLELHRPSSE